MGRFSHGLIATKSAQRKSGLQGAERCGYLELFKTVLTVATYTTGVHGLQTCPKAHVDVISNASNISKIAKNGQKKKHILGY